jgi:hypothetical protein
LTVDGKTAIPAALSRIALGIAASGAFMISCRTVIASSMRAASSSAPAVSGVQVRSRAASVAATREFGAGEPDAERRRASPAETCGTTLYRVGIPSD